MSPGDRCLTKRLTAYTKEVHDEDIRNNESIQLALLVTSRPLYRKAICLFAALFKHLESILERQKDHTHLGLFHKLLPVISRADGFQADASYFLIPSEKGNKSNDNSKKEEVIPLERSEYLDRLDTLEKEDPTRLIAYIFHLYMAVFAGGYIVKRIVKKAFRLPKDSDEGIQGFSMNNDNALLVEGERKQMSPKQIRKEMKRIINEEIAPNLNDKEIQGLMEESLNVFRCNNALAASVSKTAEFEAAKASCKNFVIIPSLVVLLAIFCASLCKPLTNLSASTAASA